MAQSQVDTDIGVGEWWTLAPKGRKLTKRQRELLEIFRSSDGRIYLNAMYLPPLLALIAGEDGMFQIDDRFMLPASKILEFTNDKEIEKLIRNRLNREFPNWR